MDETRLAAIIDVETTGFSPYSDEIIELSIDLISFDPESGEVFSVVDSYYGQREPSVEISPGAEAVHGITFDALRGKKLDLGSIRRIASQADFLVAHNASFDMRFVIQLLPETSSKPWLCTLRDIDWIGEGCTDRRLGALLDWFSLRTEDLHCAKTDSAAVIALLTQVSADGRPFLVQLLGALPARRIEAMQYGPELVERYSLGREKRAKEQRAAAGDRLALGESRAPEFQLAEHATETKDFLTFPLPIVTFSGRTFVLSGTFVFGKKRACEDALRVLGGVVADTVTLSTDYLIVGTLGDKAWAYGFFGTKIAKARQQLEDGHPIAIISEEHWLNEMERVIRLPATTSGLKS